MVDLSRILPPLTVFYGASCTGLYGSWSFNAVEGGGDAQLRPSYSLKWAFALGSTFAKPNGRIVISPTANATATLTLNGGVLRLQGARKPNVHVSATGALVVELSGSASSPTLTFTETGLLEAEHALGLVSPFDVAGQPLTVPIKIVRTVKGC
jgi:hypothetical protein